MLINILTLKLFCCNMTHVDSLNIKIFETQTMQSYRLTIGSWSRKRTLWSKQKVKKREEKDMLEKIVEIIEEKLSLEGTEITEATRFKEDLEADSLDLFDMVMEFEEEFKIEIPSEDLEKLLTVGDVVNYIKAKQA